MSVTCTRRIQFCAGHRVAGHENKCAHLHGHNYIVLVTAAAENLAKYLLETVCPRVLADTGVSVTTVRVWETENCYAEAVA